jgi:hypothetical protein
MAALTNGDPVSQTKDSSTLEEHAEHRRRLIAVLEDNMRETRDILASSQRAHAEAIQMAKEEQEELGNWVGGFMRPCKGRLSCWTSSTEQLRSSKRTIVTA